MNKIYYYLGMFQNPVITFWKLMNANNFQYNIT